MLSFMLKNSNLSICPVTTRRLTTMRFAPSSQDAAFHHAKDASNATPGSSPLPFSQTPRNKQASRGALSGYISHPSRHCAPQAGRQDHSYIKARFTDVFSLSLHSKIYA